MSNTKIAIIAGAPGVGKTTIARRTCETIQERLECIVVHIEVDDVRWMILGDNSDCSPHPMWLKLVESIVNRAMTFAEVVIIEGLFYESRTVERLLIRYPDAKIFMLEASLEICLERNRNREVISERLNDEEIKRLHLLTRPTSWKRLNANLPIETLAIQLVSQIL
ncbi:AAA family ATPase [Planktothrix sp. FACHB-1355]|uniref:AAA family ATPase n=1 Tax=Aerosakkonema funiforme FACHB-1375 TaxID=2949571 RepID=A0A926VBF2_9CYAN|nr:MULTISPECIES: AAA family ATPase [Oscillatoriales]MBD2180595.1 AAA family ATPase [Aerosakkonema funiforme FACHB-1375]MBD3557645.1 AAA family ATPase [Planktothrix sp. FACHB-1355]